MADSLNTNIMATPVKETITRKITFKNHVLRDLSTMASHYHFDKPVKQDELLSMMIEEISNAISFDNDHELQFGSKEQQDIAINCQRLIQSIIVSWN